jgi:hypothetical protein
VVCGAFFQGKNPNPSLAVEGGLMDSIRPNFFAVSDFNIHYHSSSSSSSSWVVIELLLLAA